MHLLYQRDNLALSACHRRRSTLESLQFLARQHGLVLDHQPNFVLYRPKAETFFSGYTLFLIPQKAGTFSRALLPHMNKTKSCALRCADVYCPCCDRPLLFTKHKTPPILARRTRLSSACLAIANPARVSAQRRWGICQSDERSGRAGTRLGEGQLRNRRSCTVERRGHESRVPVLCRTRTPNRSACSKEMSLRASLARSLFGFLL